MEVLTRQLVALQPPSVTCDGIRTGSGHYVNSPVSDGALAIESVGHVRREDRTDESAWTLGGRLRPRTAAHAEQRVPGTRLVWESPVRHETQ